MDIPRPDHHGTRKCTFNSLCFTSSILYNINFALITCGIGDADDLKKGFGNTFLKKETAQKQV